MKLTFRILPLPEKLLHRPKIGHANIPAITKEGALWFAWDRDDWALKYKSLYLLKKLK
jgi:hypothetical protein